jgi:hypothetical protein
MKCGSVLGPHPVERREDVFPEGLPLLRSCPHISALEERHLQSHISTEHMLESAGVRFQFKLP